ncbi:MAG: type II toxin-antitoxin system RelB/DinJ family antitoxin [Firmicutes bacterium]|nr:type II toxin-antitoxin system RelB/DinJ family antitoxin [Bacillota bacterium]
MATKNITFRLDETLKKQAEIIYTSMGLTMSSALQLFVTQTVSKGSIPFIIEADEEAKHRAYVLRELAESKNEALDPLTVPDDHSNLIREWKAKREARKNAV